MQQTTAQQVFELPPSVAAPAQARRLCERVCRDWDLPSLVDACVLLASELVTNAVLHGAGPVMLEIEQHDRRVRVAVANASAARSVAPRNAGAHDEDGRGLAIVAAIAARWGSHRDDVGTRVWFELSA